MDSEEHRAVTEGLDEESLAIYDLIKKPELTPKELQHIRGVAGELLERLKTEKLRVDRWRDKQATRDAVRMEIYDYLYDDRTGLPAERYGEDEVKALADEVFRHVFIRYPEGTRQARPAGH